MDNCTDFVVFICVISGRLTSLHAIMFLLTLGHTLVVVFGPEVNIIPMFIPIFTFFFVIFLQFKSSCSQYYMIGRSFIFLLTSILCGQATLNYWVPVQSEVDENKKLQAGASIRCSFHFCLTLTYADCTATVFDRPPPPLP